MTAMILETPGQALRATSVPIPIPGPDQVRLRISACGVCRTDLHVIDGELRDVPPGIIPGHEIVGSIDAIGEVVSGLKPGQRVGVPWLGSTCGICSYCRDERENLCDDPGFTGYTINGGYAEYTLAKARYVFPLPEALESGPGSEASGALRLWCSGPYHRPGRDPRGFTGLRLYPARRRAGAKLRQGFGRRLGRRFG